MTVFQKPPFTLGIFDPLWGVIPLSYVCLSSDFLYPYLSITPFLFVFYLSGIFKIYEPMIMFLFSIVITIYPFKFLFCNITL